MRYPVDDEPAEPSIVALIADTSSAMLDVVTQIDRISARQAAWKAEFIDNARRIALMTEEAVITVGTNFSEIQRRDLARRAFVAEVACELRLPERTAIALIDESEALMHRLPLTLTALRNGDISYRHAQRLIDQTATLDDRASAQLEEEALPFARDLTPSRFAQKTRMLRERLAPESAVARREKCASDRNVEYVPARDGMAWLSFYTTAPIAGALFTSIRAQSISLQGPRESRTLGQLDADVGADALFAGLGYEPALPAVTRKSERTSSIPTGPRRDRLQPGADQSTAFRRIKPNVTITVPVLTLLGTGDEPATLDGYGPIDIETARQLVGQATSFTRVLTDPETGAALSWGTRRYKPTKRMRRFLGYRDQRCRFPGCNRATESCDIDHTVDYQFGGRTHLDNLAYLCPKHHRIKHDTTWKAESLGGGDLRWTSPNGRQYVTHPENEVRPFGSTRGISVTPGSQTTEKLDEYPIPDARAVRRDSDRVSTASSPPTVAPKPDATRPPPGTRLDSPPF